MVKAQKFWVIAFSIIGAMLVTVAITSYALLTAGPGDQRTIELNPTEQMQPIKQDLIPSLPETFDETIIAAVTGSEPYVLEDLVIEQSAEEHLLELLGTLESRIANDGGELFHPTVGPNREYYSYRRQILQALNQDPSLLEPLLDMFEQDPNSLMGREIAAVLAENGSPEAQDLAIEIATNPYEYDHAQRASALLVVAEMEGITASTRDSLLSNIQGETDSELTQFSLMALKTAPSTNADYQRVHQVLGDTMKSDDEHIRRHAAHQTAVWATSDEDLAPLRTMARDDVDVNVRARAIGSIIDSGYKSQQNKTVLMAVANDRSELAPIRQLAWKALQQYQLSVNEQANYAILGEQIQKDAEILRSQQ